MDFEEACRFARQWSAHIARKARLTSPPQHFRDETSTCRSPTLPESRPCDGSQSRKSDS